MPLAQLRLEQALDKIKSQKSDVSFTRLYREEAMREAKAADSRRTPLSPLDGRIISIKDLFDVKGEVTWAGSKILKDAPPAFSSSPIVTRLRDAGAVIIGKTNMSEFAFHGLGINHTFGTPLNAANPLHVPGGSSSGAAVSVGLGTSEIAIGTDTGGSIRLPAAFNGIVGFKPSQYRVTRKGAFPLSHSLDSIGSIAKNLQDCIDCDAVIAGAKLELAAPTRRLAVAKGGLVGEGSLEVQTAFKAALAKLNGFELVEIDMQPLLTAVFELLASAPLVTIEAAAIHQDWILARPQDYYEPVLARISVGAKVTGANYIRGLWRRGELVAQFKAMMQGFDGLLLPTALVTAPLISEVESSLESFLAHNAKALRNCTFGNILDCCGASLPIRDLEGMPVGLQIMGANGMDASVLSVGLEVEKALGCVEEYI